MHKITQAVKLALLGGSIAMTQQALAQQSTDAQSADTVEKIQITGSRILREGAIAPSPVTVLSGESLLNTGAMNIGEALNELPALASTYSLSNSGQFIGTAGLSLLDLRGMGTERTLVLVNGKRHVASSAGTASVDTNTIPTSWIERVEIITGGASAVYGADAVTGVVNFILKDKIEGLQVSATKGYADNHDYSNDKYSFSYGTNFNDDRGNIAFSVEHSSQESLNALDNPWTSTSFRNLANQAQTEENKDSLDVPDDIYTPNAGIYALSNAGTFAIGDDYYSFNPNGSVRDVYLGDNVDGIACENCDFINLNQFTELQPEFDRTNYNLKLSYDLTDNIRGYVEGKYARTRSTNIGQPAFFFFEAPEDAITIQNDNPYVGDDLRALMGANNLTSITIDRMLTDVGRRIEDDERETTAFVAGLEGYINDDWGFETYITRGETKLERANKNNLVLANFYNAVDAVEADDGSIVCRNAQAQAAGCAPLNLLGDGAPSQEAIDYVNTTSVGNSTITQTVVGGSVNNSGIYELPAGYVGFAAGIEYRKEESEIEEPDNATGTFFNVLGEDKGDFDVKEAYVEFSVPLLTDLPGIQDLNFETALRIADYSTIGNAKSWKLGLDWQVYDDLRIRSTHSSALRAPNISELFGEASQTFFSIDDPCKTSELGQLADASTRTANCAALGVPTDFDSDYDQATIEGEQGGNINLRAEESKSTTVGVVYQPAYLEGFVATIDYWKIELTDAISSVDSQTILDRCVDNTSGVNNDYCSLISRDASGEISQIRSFALNLSGQDASGVDFEFGYDFDALGGSFKTNLIGTYLIERKEYPFQEDTSDYVEYAGTAGESEWQGMLSVNYMVDAWQAGIKTRYLERVSIYDNQQLAVNPNRSTLMEYGSYAVSDVTVGYAFENGFSLTVGVDNVFNRELPYGTTGTGENTGAYENIGRFGYVTVSYEM